MTNRSVLLAGLWLCFAGVAHAQSALRPFLRVEAGALDPNEPTQVTLAIGASSGLDFGRHSLLFQLMKQSENGNASGDLVASGRTLALLAWESRFAPSGRLDRVPFIHLAAGRMSRAPLKAAGVVGGGVGLRYRMTNSLQLIGTLQDLIAFLPKETFHYCPDPSNIFSPCADYATKDGPQHNFGLTMALEWHP